MSKPWVRRMLTAELLSDAHFGTGSGGGGIDALISRDRYGRPVIWASHVEGVLRDAARRLFSNQVAENFFGRAGGDYQRSDRQRAIFTSLYVKDDPESHIWRATARESFDNRAPKDDTLRVVEYVPKGTQLTGEVELPEDELLTLQRLVQEVDRLGSGRAAGAGRVRLSLSENPVPLRNVSGAKGILRLLLRNRDPLCITATATPDNLIPSLAFIPGRALLGAMAAWLIAEGEQCAAALLTSGRVSVGDALPLPCAPTKLEDVEVLPAPLSLQSEKPQGVAGDVPWWAQPIAPTKRVDAWQVEEKLKRPEDDLFVFRADASASWVCFRPARRVRLRNGRPDPHQPGASLFAIEQIVEETYFLTELCGSPEDVQQLTEKLGPVLAGQRWLRIGRAGAPVEVVQLAGLDAATTANVTDRMRLTLTSDLLVRDELLRWRTALDETALKALLGNDIQLGRSLQDSVPVYGFNGTSRLWRMPAVAIRRGSVFEVSGSGCAALVARAAKHQWLGERTHEGFGRFRLDVVLPGMQGETAGSHAPTPTGDVSEEAIAATTQDWFNAHKSLARTGSASDRKPSLSQWLDLVGDLERAAPQALPSRINPQTAGGRNWKHPDARAVLEKLAALPPEQQKLYARFFVRWLRAELRRQVKESQ